MFRAIKNLLLCCCLSAFLFTSNAHADDTKKLIGGLAVGLIGMALNEAAQAQDEEANSEKENINWNNSSQQKASQSTLTYSDEVAEIQLKLKKAGYYDGKIDGLKGQGTTQSIKNWQSDNGFEASGEIESGQFIQASQQTVDSVQTTNNNDSSKLNSKHVSKLKEVYSSIEMHNDSYMTCKNFAEGSNSYVYLVSRKIHKNHSDMIRVLEKETKQLEECTGLSDEQLSSVKAQAIEEYEQSDMGKSLRLAAKIGALTIDHADTMSRVDGCNSYSDTMKITVSHFKDKKLSCDMLLK